jgi:hypothetical protein
MENDLCGGIGLLDASHPRWIQKFQKKSSDEVRDEMCQRYAVVPVILSKT